MTLDGASLLALTSFGLVIGLALWERAVDRAESSIRFPGRTRVTHSRPTTNH